MVLVISSSKQNKAVELLPVVLESKLTALYKVYKVCTKLALPWEMEIWKLLQRAARF